MLKSFVSLLAVAGLWLAAHPAAAQQRSAEPLASSIGEIGFLRSMPQLAVLGYLRLALNVEPKRASEAPRAVTSSGQQRTISLRLAKIELMQGVGLPISAAEVVQLQNAFTQRIFMEKAVERVTAGAPAQRDMVVASDNLLRTMSGLTAMYEQELVRQLASSNRIASSSSRKS